MASSPRDTLPVRPVRVSPDVVGGPQDGDAQKRQAAMESARKEFEARGVHEPSEKEVNDRAAEILAALGVLCGAPNAVRPPISVEATLSILQAVRNAETRPPSKPSTTPEPASRREAPSGALYRRASPHAARWCEVIIAVVLVCVVGASLRAFGSALLLWGSQSGAPPPYLAFSLSPRLNSDGCSAVTPAELEAGVISGRYPHAHLRDSMVYLMVNQSFSGICAQHLGVPVCYCILDTRHFDGDGNERESPPGAKPLRHHEYVAERDYIELFNLAFVSVSETDLRRTLEANAFCPEERWRERYFEATVRYLSPGPPPRVRRERLTGTHSFNAQHFYAIMHGIDECQHTVVPVWSMVREEAAARQRGALASGERLALGTCSAQDGNNREGSCAVPHAK